MRNIRRKIDPFLVAVLVIGIAIFAFKCKITYPIKWLGGSGDSAAYPGMAENFIRGKGLSIDYIQYSYFFAKMEYPEVTHPEAHYAPLYSLMIAPFFLTLGRNAFAAKMPAMLIASIFLPLFLYLLTKRLSRSRIAGFVAALSIAVFPAIFSYSLIPDDDAIFHFIVLACCFFIIKAQDSPKYYYPAGVFIGLSYYAKGSGLWVVPIYLVFCVIWGGLKILRNRKMWVCFAIAFLVMLPWFIRNTIHFHNPVFSTQQYAAGYIGYKDWEEGTYSLYWDKDMPSLFSKFKEAGFGKVWEKSWEAFMAHLWWAFVDMEESWGEFEADHVYSYLPGIPAIIGLFLFFLSCLYFLFSRSSPGEIEQENEGDKKRWVDSFFMPWHNRELHVLWLVELSMIMLVSVTWEPMKRLMFPFIAINMAIGWTTYSIGIRQIFKWTRYSDIIATCLILLLAFPVIYVSVGEIYDDYEDDDFPYAEGGQSWMETGRWVKENIPDAIIMFREPAQLHFYTEGKVVQIPLAELDQIIKVMKFYKVTHIIPKNNMRPALRPLVEGKVPGFKLIYDDELEIYEIEYQYLDQYLGNGHSILPE